MVHGNSCCKSIFNLGDSSPQPLVVLFRAPEFRDQVDRFLFWHRIQLARFSSGPCSQLWDGSNCPFFYCFEFACYSKVIKLAGTCCLLLWQAALRCLNQSIAFILFPAWNLYEFPFSESVNKKRSGCSGSSAIITIQPTTEMLLLGVDLKCFLSVAFRDFAA